MERLHFIFHCSLAFLLRIMLVVYSSFHDENFSVPYTDVDYKVFTDAARYITNGMSPFDRHTYRYSPFLAVLLIPNINLHLDYGKFLFSFIDILVAMLMRKIIVMDQNSDMKMANFCAYLWLYNPLIIVISTRGNADCLAIFLVILTLFCLQRKISLLAGLIHGMSIHFRLYPLAFSLVMYLSLCKSHFFSLNRIQLKFVLMCMLSLLSSTLTCYYLYGKNYVHESIIYHLIRKDIRHNFSVYFYVLYLSADSTPSILQRFVSVLPQLILLIILSAFYSSRKNLAFALMTVAFVVVSYNPIVTSQYFFWFLSLFPLCFPNLKCNVFKMAFLLVTWLFSQIMWLLVAYLLEYHGINSFNYIWLASTTFFVSNVKMLMDLIKMYESSNRLE